MEGTPPPAAPTTHRVADLADLPEGSLRLVRAGDRKLCLVRTAEGVHALDHACPHEGYGLTQGQLSGTTLTCAWHNWKFDVTDGACLVGQEDVVTHDVTVADDGGVLVALRDRDPEVERERLLASLRRGMARDYVGQVSRDVVRLLRVGVPPAALVAEGIRYGAGRNEWGWDHEVAAATDCLAMVDLYEGDDRALPVVQALSGIMEEARYRPEVPLPGPAPALPADAGAAFAATVEAEETEVAQGLLLAALADGAGPDDLRPWFTAAVSAHLLSYGHGAIYAQKGFQLLALIGWEHADVVLGHLVRSIVNGTREDTLPYFRPFGRALAEVDLAALAAVTPTGADDGGTLRKAILDDADRSACLHAAVAALEAGVGVDGVLDACVAAVSERLLRYDEAGEDDLHDDFGWLDITHGVTYAEAARWHHAHTPGPDTVRLALFCVFLAHWTGRHEWHAGVAGRQVVDLGAGDLAAAGDALQREALGDGAGSFIVVAHHVKLARAAALEARRTGDPLVLEAAARFVRAPARDRFVAANVIRAVDFLAGRTPRD